MDVTAQRVGTSAKCDLHCFSSMVPVPYSLDRYCVPASGLCNNRHMHTLSTTRGVALDGVIYRSSPLTGPPADQAIITVIQPQPPNK
jgi:hypothetical protein